MTSMGVCARKALATPVTVSAVPGPAVTTATPGLPVTRVQASAACAAACSCRTSFDAFVEAAVVNVNNVPPAEGKNGLNTLCLQGTGHQMAPTNLGYNIAPVGVSLDSEYPRMALRLQRFCLKGK